MKEGEWVNLLLSACEEDGWVMGQNSDNKTGLIPASFVSQMTPEEYEAQLAAAGQPQAASGDTSPWPESAPAAAPWPGSAPVQDPWPDQTPAAAPPSLPSCPPPVDDEETSSEEEESDEDSDGGPPPGLAPPPGPPPSLSPPAPPPPAADPEVNSSLTPLTGTYLAIYDFQVNKVD